MPLLIDGHNLIGKLPDLSLEDPEDEEELAQRVRKYCWRHRRRATIVFDAGVPGRQSPGRPGSPVKLVFAPPGSSADTIIRARLRQARDPAGLLVVSSDRAVQEAARAHGARVVPAEEFASRLASHPPAQQPAEYPLSEQEVAEWLEVFEPRQE